MDILGMTVIVDTQGLVAKRYDAKPGTTYLLRPDQHVVARWRTLDTAKLQAALARATALNIGHA
jgi:3-(3-hydroxy-phenyl)propionate hydroxylase